MKNLAAITALFLLIGTHVAAADEQSHNGTEAGVVIGSATAGALIAGPIGFAAGAGIGAWLGNKARSGYPFLER